MEIRTIRFKNINSLKGEHSIDFTDKLFRQNPLFAITGPTGSGKTTILDVISLALFNKVPRLDRISRSEIEQKGAILTRNQLEAFAEVTYQCQAGVYTSVWSISTNRNGNLRDYEMEIYRVDKPETLGLKKAAVPQKNEALIGLNYDQFIKSVVLAQGEFAKFLKANKKERSQLLEQITGTGIYRQLGRLAYDTYKAKNSAIEDQIKIIADEKNRLLAPEKAQELQQNFKAHKAEQQRLETRLELVKAELSIQESIQELQTKKAGEANRLTAAEHNQKLFLTEEGKRLEQHELVQAFAIDLQTWTYKTKEIATHTDAINKLTNELETTQTKQQQALSAIQSFIKSSEKLENPLFSLRAFGEKVEQLEQERQGLITEYKGKSEQFNREVEGVESGVPALELVKHPEKWELVKQSYTQKTQAWKNRFGGKLPENVSQKITEQTSRIEKLQVAEKAWLALQHTMQQLKDHKRELQQIEKDIAELPTELEHLKAQLEKLDLTQKNLKLEQANAQLQMQLEDYRLHLHEGEACPLCGSLAHPYAQELPEHKDNLAEQLQQVEGELRTKNKTFSKKETQLKLQQDRIAELRLTIAQRENEVAEQVEKFTATHPSETLQWSAEEWETCAKKLKTKKADLEQLRDFLQELDQLKRALPLYKSLQSIKAEGELKKKEIERYYTGKSIKADVAKYETNWRKIQQTLERLQDKKLEEVKRKSAAEQIKTDLENQLLPQLNERGFQTVELAKKALIAHADYQKLNTQKKEYADTIQQLKAQLNTYKAQLIEQIKKRQTEQSLEQLISEKTDLTENQRKLIENLKEEERQLKNHDDLQKRIIQREDKIAQSRHENWRWEHLNKLIGDAKGDQFNQFAQDMTLRHLLKLANKRLQNLSDRYRLAVSTQVDKDNLVVADLDMGGQERSVKTLSGGETFLMSLSLALALSDLASQNVSINSLFIDEGFGTLDPDTLDQTLDTLERLQADSSKTIGIISHVESLKERIGLQIQLTRNGQGYSSLAVVEA